MRGAALVLETSSIKLPPWFLRRPHEPHLSSRGLQISVCCAHASTSVNVLRATAIHVSQTPSCQLTQSSCIAASHSRGARIGRNYYQQTISLALRSSILSDDVFPSTATDVFVGNMPYGMSDDYVKDLVYTVRKDDGSPVNPEVLRVTVPRDEETGKDRGLAFVKVLDATQAADLSAALDGFEYRGRVLNSNVKESRKKKWVERPAVDPATLDDGGLFEALDALPDKFAIQEYGLEKIRNACKKARIKAGGDLLLRHGVAAEDPGSSPRSTSTRRSASFPRGNRRNARCPQGRIPCFPRSTSTSTSASRTATRASARIRHCWPLIVPSFLPSASSSATPPRRRPWRNARRR